LLKHLFPDFPVELIKVADTRKPFLENEAYHFSISHCGDYAVAIVSKTARVGVDIELPTEKVVRISHKFLHADELEQWSQTKDIQLATVLWSVKEAMFKWWGKGNVDFSEMLRIEDVHLKKDQVFHARFIKDDIAVSFPVHYKLFDEIVLAWVKTDSDIIKPD
jgi:phosphopantetheinyl transferase